LEIHRTAGCIEGMTAVWLMLTGCPAPQPQATAEAKFNRAVQGIIEADGLKDARMTFARSGWESGRLQGTTTPCPAPLEVWPVQHLYRSKPATRAELYVLALPWLSPAEVRAVRELAWRGATGASVEPGSQRSDELTLGGARYQRDLWQVGVKQRWNMTNLLRAWPDLGGTYLLGACAPAESWEEARAALEEAAGGLQPVRRIGLEVAVERAEGLRDAARTWRVVLEGPALEARVATARKEAKEALRVAPGFEASGEALGAMAELAAMGRQGVEFGPGYDPRAVEDLIARVERVAPARARGSGMASLRGHALLDLGEPAMALEQLEPIALRLPRPTAELLFDIGEAQLALGRRPEAEEAWRRAARTLAGDRRVAFQGDGPLATDVRRRCDALEARIVARLGP